MAAFSDLDHELITLIADNLPVKAVARLSLTCKLGNRGVGNHAQYNHMRTYRHVINDINSFKYIAVQDENSGNSMLDFPTLGRTWGYMYRDSSLYRASYCAGVTFTQLIAYKK